MFKIYYECESKFIVLFSHLETAFNFSARIYLFSIFFVSGLTKLRDWDSTLFLFSEEYTVPFIPPNIAAYLGTAGELLLPVFLVFGLFSRFNAAGLFIVNLVAALSLPELSDSAAMQHGFWGVLILLILLQGGQRLSLDSLITSRKN